MKLASLKGGRDGHLVVVSKDLTRCLDVSGVAPTLQAALDDWDVLAPALASIAAALERGEGEAQAFNPRDCAAPLPRAYQWLDGSAYVNHVALVRKARGAEMPESFWTDPLMYQGGSDVMLGPCDSVPLADEAWGIDLEAEVVVVLGDVPMGATREEAAKAIKLIMLVNDVSLRNLILPELSKGFGFVQSKPASSFSPVAVTLDELAGAWRGDTVHLPLRIHLNGAEFGRVNAGIGATFAFPDFIAHAAKTRALCAGTIVGGGTVSNAEPGVGSSCIAERRAQERIQHGSPATPFLKFGDRVRIEMLDASGQSVFGAIDQKIIN